MLIKIRNKEYKVEMAITFFQQLKGLMFSDKKNMLFILSKEKTFDMHMYFVFFPIIAIFLNEKREVVNIKKLGPFSYYENKTPAKYLLELSEENDVKLGDVINW